MMDSIWLTTFVEEIAQIWGLIGLNLEIPVDSVKISLIRVMKILIVIFVLTSLAYVMTALVDLNFKHCQVTQTLVAREFATVAKSGSGLIIVLLVDLQRIQNVTIALKRPLFVLIVNLVLISLFKMVKQQSFVFNNVM
jgi:hypothetical protein